MLFEVLVSAVLLLAGLPCLLQLWGSPVAKFTLNQVIRKTVIQLVS